MSSSQLSTHAHAIVVTLESHFFSSAPALTAVTHPSGWLIRTSGGYTKRGNSASPLTPHRPLDEAALAQLRMQMRHPHIIRITPLANNNDNQILQNLGWRLRDPSVVMTRQIEASAQHHHDDVSISTLSVPDAEWVDGFARSSHLSPSDATTFQSTLNLIRHPFVPCYVTLVDGSSSNSVAYGQAVRSAGIIGLFNIVVPAAHRGKGYGRRMTQALLDWGAESGAQMAYLQVTEGNAAGRQLYESMGFKESYRYHYMVGP